MKTLFRCMSSIFFAVLLLSGNSLFSQIQVYPSYYENFDNGEGDWTSEGNNSSWEFGTPDGSDLYGANSGSNAWATSLYGNYNSNEFSYLTSPQFDMSCLSEDPTLEFAHAYFIEEGWDFYWVEISINGGDWQKIGTSSSGSNWYQQWYDYNTGENIDAFGGYYWYSYGWDFSSHSLEGAAGSSDVRIRFVMSSDGSAEYDGVAIDDIYIYSNSTSLPPITLSSPINGLNNAPLDIQLAWISQSCADNYQVQLSLSSDFSSAVIDRNDVADSKLDVFGLSYERTYYWRVRGIKDGNAGTWSSVRNFTTIIAPPSAPSLIAPANMSANMEKDALQLRWSTVPFTNAYRVQISTDPSFASVAVDVSQSSSYLDISSNVQYGVTYYWRVNATNISGSGPWSQSWNFTMALPSPVASFPPNNSTGISVPVSFQWQGYPTAPQYELQVALDNLFSNIIFTRTSNTSPVETSILQTAMRYYWRVRVLGNNGVVSGYTPTRTFSTQLPSPSLTTPYDGEVDVAPESVNLTWQPLSISAEYRIQIASASSFSPQTLLADRVVSESKTTLNSLSNNQRIYWRVQAISQDIGESNWTSPYVFVTLAASTKAVLPADGSRGVQYPVKLEWENVGSAQYQVQIAADAGFAKIVINQIVEGKTFEEFSNYHGLEFFQTYHWRVRPVSRSNKDIAWTVPRVFTSGLSTADVVAPSNRSNNQSVFSTFRWTAVRGAVSYHILVSKSADLQNPVFDATVLSPWYTPADNLELGAEYFWNVTAISAQDGSTTSPIWSFSTSNITVAAIPDLSYPANGQRLLQGVVTMEWKSVKHADFYHIQVAADKEFAAVVFEKSDIASPQFSQNFTQPNMTYFWRASSINGAGESEWSEIRTFSIGANIVGTPLLSLPPHNAVRVEPIVVFSWHETPNAASYTIEVAKDNQYEDVVYRRSNLVGIGTPAVELEHNTTYYWRVAARDDSGLGEWSQTWNFTTSAPSSTEEEEVRTTMLASIYPQPANDAVTLLLPKGWADVRLLSLTALHGIGINVAWEQHGGVITAQTSSVCNGVYLMRITDGVHTAAIPIVVKH